MASGDQDSSPHLGFPCPLGRHAALLRHYHQTPPPRPRQLTAAASHEGDRVCGCGLPPLLDAIPPGSDDGHLLQDEDRAVPVSGQDGGGSGRVRHPEPGSPPQLRQPGAVRFCGGEVQEEAAAADEEDEVDREIIHVEKQPVVPLIRNHIKLHVSTQTIYAFTYLTVSMKLYVYLIFANF